MLLPTLGRRVLFLALVCVCVLLSSRANADPIRIATIEALWIPADNPDGLVKVDLPSNPGAILAGRPIQIESELRAVVTFDAVLAGRQSGILRATFDWPDGWKPPFSFLVQEGRFDFPGGADIITFGMDFPIVYHPVPVTLTLSVPGEPGGGIIGPSTVTFSVVQPVPEPTSMALVGTGLGLTMLRRIRRKTVKRHGRQVMRTRRVRSAFLTTLCVAIGAVMLPGSARADSIRLSVYNNAAGAIVDFDGDGVPDRGGPGMAVLHSSTGTQDRAFAEYDVRGLALDNLTQAWFEGPVQSGAFDGLIAVSAYAGSGAFNFDDYAGPTIPIGTFPFPPFGTTVDIRIDVTSALRQLVSSGVEFAALRFDPVGLTDAALIGGRFGESTFLVLETAQTPEPATLLMLATGLGIVGARRRRQMRTDTRDGTRSPLP